jgi:MerR family transcriptional regulator, light-induced transcriptional regulator
LGVSSSTIKRWVDSGTIKAVRTAGKHRLIPISEALRVARNQGIDAANVEVLGGLGRTRLPQIDNRIRDLLFNLVVKSKVRQAKVLIQSVYAAGCGAAMLGDDLIRPVMERVGHGWMVGALDVYQEHEASQILASAIQELIERAGSAQLESGPIALGAAAEGDPYVLPALLGELVLREMGWQVRNLGINLPLRSLAHATLALRPRLVFASMSFIKDEDAFVNEYQSFYEAVRSANAAVIVGGQALSPELRSRLVYASFGDRMAHLAEFAQRITPAA